ncbi:hypothetical protein CNMCM5793_004859 [Aspergillus hiratsukae]|uniref:CFEM domain-containing protein n=1 Tax=Aspergillus hiratsukae TaxID=1194566 RepID=A0A8H6NZS0_9EURO|nr:hypothetical protein CNMCM5793_004859 [Aspergillus hiratsukae]
MRLSTILSVPPLPAAVLAGPVAAPAKPDDVGPLPFPNPIAVYFEMMGAPSCSFGCINRAIAATSDCTGGVLDIACFCASSDFVPAALSCAADDACSAEDCTRLTAAFQLGCGLARSPIGGGGGGGISAESI